jgi:hypothetical protein
MTSINSVMAYALMAGLPFGGVGDSGFGRIHGDEGLYEFVRAKAVTHELFQVPGFGMVFAEPKEQLEQMRKTIRTVYGGSLLDGASSLLRRVGLG